MWEIRFHFHVRVSSWGTNPRLFNHESRSVFLLSTWYMISLGKILMIMPWPSLKCFYSLQEYYTLLKSPCSNTPASSSSLQLQSSWPPLSDSHLQFFHPDHGSSDDICNVVILGQVSTPCHDAMPSKLEQSMQTQPKSDCLQWWCCIALVSFFCTLRMILYSVETGVTWQGFDHESAHWTPKVHLLFI